MVNEKLNENEKRKTKASHMFVRMSPPSLSHSDHEEPMLAAGLMPAFHRSAQLDSVLLSSYAPIH